MAFPLGVTVTARTTPPTGGIPTATDTWFVLADTDVGDDTVATQVSDLADFENQFGPRLAGNIALWDALDVYFREGGKRAYIAVGTDATALDQFTGQLGPGQLSAIGGTPDDTLFEMLWTHAADHNRVVIGDVPGPSVQDVGDLIGLADGVSDVRNGTGGLFGPWVVVPGPAGVTGVTERQVPASPVIAALCARVDETGNPNQAAAGRQWPLQYVVDFTQTFTDVDRADLLDAGVNLFANIYGVLENYGFQTPQALDANNPYWQFNVSRTRMWILARAKAIGENYVFRPIDGKGLIQKALEGDLSAMLGDLYAVNGLYGATPQDAYAVVVNAAINTVALIAQGQLHAVMEVRPSLHAKAVYIELVTIPLTGVVN